MQKKNLNTVRLSKYKLNLRLRKALFKKTKKDIKLPKMPIPSRREFE